jgi:hypothetical protein
LLFHPAGAEFGVLWEPFHYTARTLSYATTPVASDRLWTFLLVAIGSASSVIYPHPPLAAFGAIAGTTLTPRRALSAAADTYSPFSLPE